MKKVLLASFSALALLTAAACSDTDDTTTQSVNPPANEQMDATPEVAPTAPADPAAPADTIEPAAPAEPAPAN